MKELKELLQDCIRICELVEKDTPDDLRTSQLEAFFGRLLNIRTQFALVDGKMAASDLPQFDPALRTRILGALSSLESITPTI